MITKALHIVICLNMLFSSFGIHVFEHVCNKKGTTTGLFIKPKSCCSPKKSNCHTGKDQSSHQPNSPSSEFSKKPCCEDLTHFIKGATLGVKQVGISFWKHLSFEKTLSTTSAFDQVYEYPFYSKIYSQHYYPPEIILDIYRLIRVIRC